MRFEPGISKLPCTCALNKEPCAGFLACTCLATSAKHPALALLASLLIQTPVRVACCASCYPDTRASCQQFMLRLGLPTRALNIVKVQQSASRKCGKAVKKGDLPSKTCVCCGRPFTWRKKWESCWDEVRHVCSLHFGPHLQNAQ